MFLLSIQYKSYTPLTVYNQLLLLSHHVRVKYNHTLKVFNSVLICLLYPLPSNDCFLTTSFLKLSQNRVVNTLLCYSGVCFYVYLSGSTRGSFKSPSVLALLPLSSLLHSSSYRYIQSYFPCLRSL